MNIEFKHGGKRANTDAENACVDKVHLAHVGAEQISKIRLYWVDDPYQHRVYADGVLYAVIEKPHGP